MKFTTKITSVVNSRIALPNRPSKRAPRPERKPSSRRCRLRVEHLETRVTPSILGTFELDGNAATGDLTTGNPHPPPSSSGSQTTSHDWDQVFADAGSPAAVPSTGSFSNGPTSLALAGTFINDRVSSTSDDIFTGGGSKDTNGLQSGPWLFTAGKPQGKDDITHAYAAAYTDPSTGHLLLYAGLDRFDNSGDATAGFWFFGNKIGEGAISKANGTGPFTGTHQDGDILLISDFTIGGSVSTIAVYRWTGNDATGHLVNVTALGNPNTFAIVNGGPISTPWSYTNKRGATQPDAGEFLEEGVDLTALGLGGCFNTFMAETRSSQSPTATLSDFALGSFPLCSLAAPQFTGLSKVGDPVQYRLQVTNTGAMPLFIQSVTDAPAPTGQVSVLGNIVVNHVLQAPGAAGVDPSVTEIKSTFDFTQPLAPNATLTIFVTRTVQASDPDPTDNTVTFVGTDDLAGTADPIKASVMDEVNLFQPSATMTEVASPTAGVVGTPITYTYTVTNTSSSDSPNLVLGTATSFFTDSLFPNMLADAIAAMPIHPGDGTGQLAPGGSFSFTETRPIQASDPTPLTDSPTAGFTLVQSPIFQGTNVIHASASSTVHIVDANISIAPSAVNEVGQEHTFTVTVNQILDGVSSAAQGASVTVTLTGTNGANPVPFDSVPFMLSGTTDSNGQFFVHFTSLTAGIVTGHATATLTVSGVPLARATDSTHGSTGDATKRFVDANISIAPNAVNEVGAAHTFTVTVDQNDGLGGGFVPASGASVIVTLTPSNGAAVSPFDSVPLVLNGTTNASGQFQVTFTSLTAGLVTGNATATLTVSGVPLTRATGDSHTGDSGPATKRFVDAFVTIAPNATNGITDPHTFIVTLMQNDGLGGGFVAASGASVTVSLTNSGGAVAIPESPLSGTTDGSGQFQVKFTSDSPGQVIGNATATLTVGGVSLTRATGDSHTGDSGPATKTFVAGSLKWLKEDSHGNLLGGATFLVTATGGDALNSTPLSVSVVDNGPFDADPTPGVFQLKPFQSFLGSPLTGLALGTYTIQETAAPSGFNIDPTPQTVNLTLSSLDGGTTTTPPIFVDTKPNVSITKAVSPGFASTIKPGDTASFTITVTNSGDGSASNVVVTDNLPDPSKLTWSPSYTGGFTGSITAGVLTAMDTTLAAGATATITVSAVIPVGIFGNTAGTPSSDPVPLGLFELDGNATTGNLTSGNPNPPPSSSGSQNTSHDWDQIFADAGSPTSGSKSFTAGPTSGANAGSFVFDAVNTTGDDIFTGGGSKDTNGLQEGPWLFTDGKPQGKDDIENAFAAQYVDPATNDVILYAGADRFDNSGNSTMGFWFFVNPIGEGALTKGNGTGPFTGTHTDGDILLLSNFTIGGSVSTIAVYKWVGDDATGSLQLVTGGDSRTFAIVNNAPISVPWAFTEKHGATQPQTGEFLEEGVNLSALGLGTCFSTFLAETRSSQSPTATLSDFVLGSFNTCSLQLPNQASLSYDIPGPPVVHVGPITSNQVLITVNDGHPLLATSSGPGAASSLTEAQLQPLLAQAANYWLTAGVPAQDLHVLDNFTVELTSLAGGELGLEAPGHIWLDRTAAGWGWSIAGGQMDLQSVLTHEVGHALGFEHSATGVMEAALAPGVRLVPPTLAGTGTGVVAAAAPGDFGVSAGTTSSGALAGPSGGEIGVGLPGGLLSTPSSTGAIDTVFATPGRGGDTLPGPATAGAMPAALPGAAGVARDGAAIRRGLDAVLGDRALPVSLPLVAPVPAAVVAGPDQGPEAVLIPALRPPAVRVESTGDGVLPDDSEPAVSPASGGIPGARPLDRDMEARAGVGLRELAWEACFADGSWAPDLTGLDAPVPGGAALSSGPAADAAAAAAVFVLALGGYGFAPRVETEPRRRRPSLI
jgi:hypothetical protein